MATTTQASPPQAPPEARLVFARVRWNDYQAMLQIVGERRLRVTYDDGTMEVRMPSQRHEQAAQSLGLFVTRLAEELEIPYEPLGMTSWKLPGAAKGLEADQCYYIQHHARLRPADVERFLELGRTTDKIRWARELRDWVRSALTARTD